jgi:putative SOS response-associated peptidase YedK
MCGRYYRTADKSDLQDVFKALATGAAANYAPANYAPAYNISPHSIQLIVRQARDLATREIVAMRWGLIGHRTKGPGSTITPHIARADSLERSALWSEPFHKRRCIIPANGYFEWLQPQAVPYCYSGGRSHAELEPLRTRRLVRLRV